MHAHGVDVLHGADGDGGVVGVAHHLELDLLVALDALFHQHFVDGGEVEGVSHKLFHLFRAVYEAAARAAQREGGAKDNRVADFFGRGHAFLNAVANLGRNHRFVNAQAQFLEQFAVFGLLDVLEGSSQDLHAAFFQNAFLGQLDGQVQAGLAAEAGHQGVRTLVADDLGHIFQGEGLHIHLVGYVGVRHDGGRVGIHQDYLIPLFLEGQAGLGAGIVKLCGLANHNGAGAYYHYFLDIRSSRHSAGPPSSL